MKNILILTYSKNTTGGIEKVTNDLFNALKGKYNINILALDEVQMQSGNIFSKIYNKFLMKLIIFFKINMFDPSLIVSTHPFLLKNLIIQNRKKICWVHGIDIFGKNGLRLKNELEKCKLIVSVSNFTKNHLINLGYSSSQIKVINNCIDINEFKFSKIDQSLPFKILTVGRLSKAEQYKGHDLVIDSLSKITQNSEMNIRYLIVGDGDDKERLVNLANEKKVQDYVEFRGKLSLEKIIKSYNESHLFVMPSYFKKREDGTYTGEGFGIVYIEAGAIGRPVIGCDVGGQTDCIIDGYNGLLVKPDSNEIAKKIECFINNPDKLIEMGMNNRKYVEKRFSLEIFKKNVLKLIENII